MISIISSIIVAISVLVATLITFTPNARVIMESDFMRSARNNAYLYSWELAQLNVRTGNLTVDVGSNKKTVLLGYLSKKVIKGVTTEPQKLKADISYVKVTPAEILLGKEDHLVIQVDKE